MQLIKAAIVLLISTAVLLTDSLPVSKRQAPPPPPPPPPFSPFSGGTRNSGGPNPVIIQSEEIENPRARCIQLEINEEQEFLCILDRLEDDFEHAYNASGTCDDVDCGCSFRTPPATVSETRFAMIFSWLVEDVHLYKEHGIGDNYSETICRLERMMKTQTYDYSLNDTIRDYCECNNNTNMCEPFLAPFNDVDQETNSSGEGDLNTLRQEHDYCFLKQIHTTLKDHIIKEIKTIRGLNGPRHCIRANSGQEIALEEFDEDIQTIRGMLLSQRTGPCYRPALGEAGAFYLILSLLQEPLQNSSNSDLQNLSDTLREQILPTLSTLLESADIEFRNITIPMAETINTQNDFCLVEMLSTNFASLYDNVLKKRTNNLITKRCLPLSEPVSSMSTTPMAASLTSGAESSPTNTRPRTPSPTSRFRNRSRTPPFS